MERREYEKLIQVEDAMWWFRGLRANLIDVFRARKQTSTERIIDIGCGTGGLLRTVAEAFPAAWSIGLDLDEGAAGAARARSGRPLCRGSVNALPFAEHAFDVIFSSDLLCHAGVDEALAAGEFYRCLRPGGVVVLNLPAYPWMLSDHDYAVSNVRRYTRQTARSLLNQVGFTDIRAVHWNSVLFPLMLLRRMILSPQGESDVTAFPEPIEQVFRGIMRFENLLLRNGVALPFGGSVLASAMRP